MPRVRFRADSPTTLAEALLACLRYARTSTDRFSLGPIELAALARDGLLLDGEVEGVKGMLAEQFPQLVEEET